VELAERLNRPRPWRDAPPDHRTSHPRARGGGLGECQGKGPQRSEAETRLGWAKKMPWKGLHPVVHLRRPVDEKGRSLRKAAMAAVEARVKRDPKWPTYDMVINPMSSA